MTAENKILIVDDEENIRWVFAQALDGTWERYKSETGREFADRDDFEDAIDFVGWYTNMSNQ